PGSSSLHSRAFHAPSSSAGRTLTMRHQDVETEAQNLLRKIVRTVDKRLQLQLNDGPTPQDPLLSVAFTRGPQHAVMELSVEELRRAGESSRDSSILRERIKRTNERLRFPKK